MIFDPKKLTSVVTLTYKGKGSDRLKYVQFNLLIVFYPSHTLYYPLKFFLFCFLFENLAKCVFVITHRPILLLGLLLGALSFGMWKHLKWNGNWKPPSPFLLLIPSQSIFLLSSPPKMEAKIVRLRFILLLNIVYCLVERIKTLWNALFWVLQWFASRFANQYLNNLPLVEGWSNDLFNFFFQF